MPHEDAEKDLGKPMTRSTRHAHVVTWLKKVIVDT